MLVLTRKRDEVVVIGHGPGEIRVMVVDICGDRVRLGITADPSIPVHRLEVFETIKRGTGYRRNEKRLCPCPDCGARGEYEAHAPGCVMEGSKPT